VPIVEYGLSLIMKNYFFREKFYGYMVRPDLSRERLGTPAA